MLAWILAELGSFEDARAWAERLVSSAQSRGRLFDEARGRWALAEVLRRMGDEQAAEVAIKEALALLEKVSALDLPGALATLAALRLQQGRAEDALVAAEDGLARTRSMGACGMFRGAFLRLVYAEVLHALGRRDAACTAIAEAKRCLLDNADKIPDLAVRAGFLENVAENHRTLELAQAWLTT